MGNNFLDLDMNRSGFVHTLNSGSLTPNSRDILFSSFPKVRSVIKVSPR